MVSRYEAYKVKRRDNLASPDFWNDRFRDLDLRLMTRENDASRIDDVVDQLEAIALQRLADTFTPLIVEAQERLNTLGASFSGESLTSLTVGTGSKVFYLTEATRENYVYTDYIKARSAATPTDGMLGQVTAFDRANGQLEVEVVSTEGTVGATHADWLIRVGAPIDTSHAGRTDNPHSTTAAQVGAYTTAAADAAIAAAIAAIPSVSFATLLLKAQNLADLPDKGQARINLGLGGLATMDSVGTGQIASSLFATIAQIRAATADKVVQIDDLFAAAAYVTLTDAATITWDATAGFNFNVTLSTNRTLGFPANAASKVGQSGFIDVTEPGGGGCTLGYASGFTFDQGVAPTLDTSGGRVTSLFYHIKAAGEVRVGLAFKGVRAS